MKQRSTLKVLWIALAVAGGLAFFWLVVLKVLIRLNRGRGSPCPASTEEFTDPDYPFALETIRRVKVAGFRLERRFGNFWLYTVNFRKNADLRRNFHWCRASP